MVAMDTRGTQYIAFQSQNRCNNAVTALHLSRALPIFRKMGFTPKLYNIVTRYWIPVLYRLDPQFPANILEKLFLIRNFPPKIRWNRRKFPW
jgi:hypothetical protein